MSASTEDLDPCNRPCLGMLWNRSAVWCRLTNLLSVTSRMDGRVWFHQSSLEQLSRCQLKHWCVWKTSVSGCPLVEVCVKKKTLAWMDRFHLLSECNTMPCIIALGIKTTNWHPYWQMYALEQITNANCNRSMRPYTCRVKSLGPNKSEFESKVLND